MGQQNPVNLKSGFFDFLADKGVQAPLRRRRTQQLQHYFGGGLEEVIKQEIRFHMRVQGFSASAPIKYWS